MEMHNGVWNKVSKGCWEIRGKTLGIVGYGHIGSQLSALAEAFGIRVIFYDIIPIVPLGSVLCRGARCGAQARCIFPSHQRQWGWLALSN